jgi:beta-lactamase superfamily II metal-dependent hydrolase
VKTIDYLLITHFQKDHGGGVPQLEAGKQRVRCFCDIVGV